MADRYWGDGRYLAVRLLGRGGTAEVWLATDVVTDRPVAVKAFLPGTLENAEDDAARFRNEVLLLAQMEHPHVVELLDAGILDCLPWCVMSLADGGSLARPGVPLPAGGLAAVGAQIADALAHVHAHGVVHRDLKPSNILLDRQGRAFLSDFGIARLAAASRITATGHLVGTAAYLAPEQVRGESVTTAADVYALGLVLLEQLTSRREYEGSAVEAALARLTRPPVVPASLGPAWGELLRAMTATDAAERPAATAARDDLVAIRDGVPRPAAVVPPVRRPTRRRRDNGLLVGCGLAVAGVLACVGAVVGRTGDTGTSSSAAGAGQPPPLVTRTTRPATDAARPPFVAANPAVPPSSTAPQAGHRSHGPVASVPPAPGRPSGGGDTDGPGAQGVGVPRGPNRPHGEAADVPASDVTEADADWNGDHPADPDSSGNGNGTANTNGNGSLRWNSDGHANSDRHVNGDRRTHLRGDHVQAR